MRASGSAFVLLLILDFRAAPPFIRSRDIRQTLSRLCAGGSESCNLIYSPVSRWWLPYCHIHYISDPSFFTRHSVAICEHILATEPAVFVAANDRQLQDNHVERSFRFRLVNGQIYRSNCSRPDQIDSLYSDIAFLNLITMDSLSTILRERLSWK